MSAVGIPPVDRNSLIGLSVAMSDAPVLGSLNTQAMIGSGPYDTLGDSYLKLKTSAAEKVSDMPESGQLLAMAIRENADLGMDAFPTLDRVTNVQTATGLPDKSASTGRGKGE